MADSENPGSTLDGDMPASDTEEDVSFTFAGPAPTELNPEEISDSSPTKGPQEPKIFATLSSTFATLNSSSSDEDYDDEGGGRENERLFSFNDPKAQILAQALPDPGDGVEIEVNSDDEDEGSDKDEWEETLVYVDLDEIPFDTELFAVRPDEYLSSAARKERESRKEETEMHPEVTLRFHNLESANPVLELGSRYYLGNYEDAMGSLLFFRKKPDDSEILSSPSKAKKPRLKSLIPDPQPPRDKVFHEKLSIDKPEYELVANVHRVLKMKRREAKAPGEQPIVLPPKLSGLAVPSTPAQTPSTESDEPANNTTTDSASTSITS